MHAHLEVRFARKFVEGAQLEMADAALEAAQHSLTVVGVRTGKLSFLSLKIFISFFDYTGRTGRPVVCGHPGEEVHLF